MNIQQEDTGQRGSFFVEQDGERLAELAYTWRGDKLISIDHTEVDEKFEGKGVASTLAEHMASFARADGIKLILYCQFAKVYFARHKEQQDLLYHE